MAPKIAKSFTFICNFIICLLVTQAAQGLLDDGQKTDFCSAEVARPRDAYRLGEQLQLSCTCPGGCGVGGLVFRHTSSLFDASSGHLHVTNQSTAELRLPLTSLDQAGDYTCWRRPGSQQTGAVIRSYSVLIGDKPSVLVGEKPCVSHGRSVLECRWRHEGVGDFPVRYFAYLQSNQAPGHWSSFTRKDEAIEDSWAKAHFRVDISEQPDLTRSVKFCARNVFGCRCLDRNIGDLDDIMRPYKVNQLRISDVTSSEAEVSWDVPNDLDPKLNLDRMKYRVNATRQGIDIPDVSLVTDFHKTKTRLRHLHPFSIYDVTVETRLYSGFEPRGEWGDVANVIISRTQKHVPMSPPMVEPGMFYRAPCPPKLSSTCLFFFWKAIPPWLYGDKAVTYTVVLRGGGALQRNETHGLQLHFDVSDYVRGNIRLILRTRNSLGVSQNSTQLVVYESAPPKPQEVTREVLSDEATEMVYWSGPDELDYMYKVFWCVRGVKSPCAPGATGELHSKLVDAGERSMTIKVDGKPPNSYAVATYYNDVSRGLLLAGEMVWAEMKEEVSSRMITGEESKTALSMTIGISLAAAIVGIGLFAYLLRQYLRQRQQDVDAVPQPKPPTWSPEFQDLLTRPSGEYGQDPGGSSDSYARNIFFRQPSSSSGSGEETSASTAADEMEAVPSTSAGFDTHGGMEYQQGTLPTIVHENLDYEGRAFLESTSNSQNSDVLQFIGHESYQSF